MNWIKRAAWLCVLIFAQALILSAQVAPASNTPAPTSSSAESKILPTGKAAFSLPPEKSQPVKIPRFEKPPVIDGKLDDEVWKSAAVFKDFYQVRPGDNLAPSQASEALIGYDSKFLYLAFRAHDEPGKVRATIAKRDNIFDDDFIGVYLDTYNDKRKAFEFFFNPLGVQADAVRTEGSGEDFSVDFVHESKGVVTEQGYTVEVAIPFKSLRYEAGRDKLWGLHVFRSIKRFNDELDSWMPLSRERTGTLSQEGYIAGLENLSTERTLEIIPSLTISETGKRVSSLPVGAAGLDTGRILNKPIELDPGVNVKFQLTPTVTLDFTYNPDFAQIEADQLVVTANQRFPIFFEEKRPFFLEGKDIFQTPILAVHTRAIVDPDYAAKLTGKVGRNTFGLLAASDNFPGGLSVFPEEIRNNPAARPSIERFLDKNATIGVLRLKRDFGKENTLGVIATTYNFIERHNHLGGFDGRFRLDPKTTLSFQVLGTNSRRFFYNPDLNRNVYRTGNAFAYRLTVDSGGRHFGYNFNGEGYTRDYRADVGFISRTNTNRQGWFLRYNTEPKPKADIVQFRYQLQAITSFDWQGRSQRTDFQPMFGLNLQRQTFLTIGYRRAYERLIEEEFGKKRTVARPCDFTGQNNALPPCGFFGPDSERSTFKSSVIAVIGSTPSKKYSFFAQIVRDLHVFDFDFGAGRKFPRVSPAALQFGQGAPLDPGPGNLWNIQTSFSYKPTDALRASLDYTKQRLVRNDTHRVAFDENIFAFRTTYQFTRFTFVRARVDYSTLRSNLRGQFLLGWTPNPGTAFYAGYNDDMTRNGFSPFTGQLEPGFRRNGRSFFIKMSYLFRRSF
ncbi:MAG: carbohydrate binding family 9 domain-containing protein [Acidobacteria bacterium]|nr:carbohydrate binding family 9 domain-containing protein [Acidobacteriota bacterium]